MRGPFVFLRMVQVLFVRVRVRVRVPIPIPIPGTVSVVCVNGDSIVSSLLTLLAWCIYTIAGVEASVSGCLRHPVGVVGAIFTCTFPVFSIVVLQGIPRCTLSIVAPTVVAFPGWSWWWRAI
jgi:hypothetical protein